ncbi:IS66 family insertion sequence element accessory protein TnpB [Rhodovulum kholense]|uniref:IS66 family insertion sequence element accessory protein TnpB n=1 Tax=Rhodovulum kholense TaxID=453584 RepID=UPI003CCBE071
MGLDPYSGLTVVVRSTRGDRLQILVWNGSGPVPICKRLGSGSIIWPKVRDGLAAPRPIRGAVREPRLAAGDGATRAGTGCGEVNGPRCLVGARRVTGKIMSLSSMIGPDLMALLPVPHPPRARDGGLQLRPQAQDPHWARAIWIGLQSLDARAGQGHRQSDPPDAWTDRPAPSGAAFSKRGRSGTGSLLSDV